MIGKYRAYSEYKDSGVEWLGKIPNHWRVMPVKYLAVLNPRKSAINSTLLNQECSFLPMEKLKLNSIVLDERRVVSDVYDGYTYFENGDVLMAKVTPCFENKNIAVASGLLNGVGFGSSEIYVLRSNDRIDNRFLFYRLQEDSFMDVATAAMTGAGGLKRVPSEVVNGYRLGVPEVDEQARIAAFLDYETARIDSLIDKQQRLIELLKEKRQAVISHAVTKGLNPDAPMKDSGVEWLGQVPEHWVVGRVKHLSQVSGGYAFSSSDFVESGVQLIKIGNLYQSRLQLDRDPTFLPQTYTESHSVFLVRKGDLLMSLTGTLGKRDYGFAVEYASPVVGLLNQRVAKFLPDLGKVDKGYLLLVLLSDNYLTQIYAMPSGTKQANLSSSDVLSPWVCFPSSKEEQSCIVKYVQERTAKLDSSVDKAEIAIKLLQERRTALISAAVTGKIDLRGWTPPREG